MCMHFIMGAFMRMLKAHFASNITEIQEIGGESK
ncbi:hypothetical protein EZS27_007377 [termite gut metagenome]|uniref:Uncharacterized protein n=1 Tax=termite gut metagenome TaxID=433724 RepID=A0A5J4SID7_9ZZZZ